MIRLSSSSSLYTLVSIICSSALSICISMSSNIKMQSVSERELERFWDNVISCWFQIGYLLIIYKLGITHERRRLLHINIPLGFLHFKFQYQLQMEGCLYLTTPRTNPISGQIDFIHFLLLLTLSTERY